MKRQEKIPEPVLKVPEGADFNVITI